MTAQSLDWARVTELFTATFEAGPEERRRLLDAEAEDALRQRVVELLAAHDAPGGVLDRSAVDSLDGLDFRDIAPVASLVGKTLGPWKVIREIGRGGMGAVYEGKRDDGEFEQRVAIKTLRTGADSAAVLQRFRQERRILAALQHPNIAALYDGGVTAEGLPYFVLEYVDGKPIDAACAERKLGLPARLDLFRQVIGAVQYAHRQLVIHRDIKPSNILVTGDGVVKLVDFGIARLLAPEASDSTADTRGPLTMSYASPEQVKGEAITTATDVYSLGVVLYRLVTGRNPFLVDPLSLERAVNAICTEAPSLPSEVAESEAAAAMQLGGATRLRERLRGDLDGIVLMALRKEPERRYPTAAAFGEDLQRFLRGLPVMAAPDTAAYRIRKFVRRRRGLVVGAGLGIMALLAGAAIAVWQARSARDVARRATDVSRFLSGMIGAGDLSAGSGGIRLGPGATVAELLDSAAGRLVREFPDDPESRARIHLALAHSYQLQERWEDAHAQYDSARLVVSRSFGEHRVEVANALRGLAETEYDRSGKIVDSLGLRSRALFEALHLTRSPDYADLLHMLGMQLAFQGRLAAGDTMVTRSVALYAALGPSQMIQRAQASADLTAIHEMLGGKSAVDAAAGYRAALATLDSVPGSDVVERVNLLWYAARLEASKGNYAAADSIGLEALHVAERAVGPSSQVAAQQLVQLASHARAAGDTAKARVYAERAVAILRSRKETAPLVRERIEMEYAVHLWLGGKLAAADSLARSAYESRVAIGNQAYIAEAGQVFGAIMRDEGKFAEAESVLTDSYRRFTALAPPSHWLSRLIAESLVRLYYAWGRPEGAQLYLATLGPEERSAVMAQVKRPTRHGHPSPR